MLLIDKVCSTVLFLFFYMVFGREVVLAHIYIFLIDIMLTGFLSPDV